MLTLPELWILLALDEKAGNLKIPRSVFQCGITGAMLLELAFIHRLSLAEGKKVKMLDTTPLNDPLLTKALRLIAKSKKPQTLLNWMIHLTMQDSRVIESFYFKQMINQDILKMEVRPVMGIFKSKRTFPTSKDMQVQIIQSLTKVIHKDFPKENRLVCLLGLVARSDQAEKLLGEEQALLLAKNSIGIFSHLEEKHFDATFFPFFVAVLEALNLSQQSAGSY